MTISAASPFPFRAAVDINAGYNIPDAWYRGCFDDMVQFITELMLGG